MSAQTTNLGSSGRTWSEIFWQAVQIVVPSVFSLVTLVFGFYISQAQGEIQNRVDDNKRVLEHQLAFQSALKEKFYERRLQVYEKACMELATAEAALNEAGTATQKEKRASDVIYNFDQVKKGNSLYWSHGLQDGLDDFWWLGTSKLRSKDWNNPTLNKQISDKIKALHKQMKDDLDVPDLANLATILQSK